LAAALARGLRPRRDSGLSYCCRFASAHAASRWRRRVHRSCWRHTARQPPVDAPARWT